MLVMRMMTGASLGRDEDVRLGERKRWSTAADEDLGSGEGAWTDKVV